MIEIYDIIKKNGVIDKFFFIVGKVFFGFYRKYLYKNETNNLLIVSLHNLGDTIFTIPAVNKIIEHYEGYKSFIVCYHDSKIIYKLKLNPHQYIEINKSDLKYGERIVSKKNRNEIIKVKPDIIVDITGTITSASLIYNARAKKIFGLKSRFSTRFTESLYDRLTNVRFTPHLINTYLDVADLVGAKQNEKKEEIIQKNGDTSPIIYIHPFASRKAKEWGLKKYIELAVNLKRKYSVNFIFQKNSVTPQIIEEIREKEIDIIETETLEDLISHLKECSLLISNDTGPIQIAALLGKNTFSIYGPTNPEYSLPVGEMHSYVNKLIECSPVKERICFTLGGVKCPLYRCMNELTIDEVNLKLNLFLDSINMTQIN
ncbi:MAG: glycosyltransferase family 9 protein [Ignavibacteriaceae bacterium]|nr:glycosyltransferase family 9 protein [Ignavibacteriaceae bacterium]